MTAPKTRKRTARTRQPTPGGKRKKRQLSAAELAQRRAAQPAASRAGGPRATGPRTDEGKAITSRNAWQHGRYSAVHRRSFGLGAASLSRMFGKPCVTTCPFHPDNADRTEAPCSLVLNELTHTGGDCLDKTVYVHAFDALLRAISEGEMEGMNGMLAAEQAASFQMLNALRGEIARNGFMLSIAAIDKAGDVVYDKDGNIVAAKFVQNPAIAPYIQLLDALHISLPEMMVTPKARQSIKDDNNALGALQTFMGRLAQTAAGRLPPGNTYDA